MDAHITRAERDAKRTRLGASRALLVLPAGDDDVMLVDPKNAAPPVAPPAVQPDTKLVQWTHYELAARIGSTNGSYDATCNYCKTFYQTLTAQRALFHFISLRSMNLMKRESVKYCPGDCMHRLLPMQSALMTVADNSTSLRPEPPQFH
jgi:hypothetical protein